MSTERWPEEESRPASDAAWSRWAGGAMLVSLFVLNCYRAATQSFVHDESLWFQYYIDGPVSRVFVPVNGYADPSYFFTLMMRLASACFGYSEFALRLPSLLLGGLYFVSVYRLCRIVFRRAWLFLLAVLIMAANPLVLDFTVAARGYGPALALLTYAFLQVVLHFRGHDSQPATRLWCAGLVKAGLATALAVAANVTLWSAATALTVTVAVLLWQQAGVCRVAANQGRWRWMWPAASFFGAEFVIAYLFLLTSPAMLVLPSFRDSMNPNRLSEDTFLGMLRDLVQCSLAHNTGLGGINSGAAVLNLLRNVIGLALVPAAVLAAAWMGWRGLRHDHDSAALPLCSALASTIVIGATAQALYVHYALDLIMPHERYALYLLPLAGLALVSAADFLQREAGPWRATGHLFFGAAVMVVLFYGCQLNWTHFLTWRYDADTKSFMQQVAARVGDHPTSPIVLGGSWYYEPTSNYYRITRQYTWMAPIYRGDSDAPYDFYILRAEDKDVVSRLGLEPIASGLVSGAVLAAQR